MRTVRALGLPADLFDGVPGRVLLAYRRRVAAEELHELRRHPAPIRLMLLAAFCQVRGREIADSLTDLLIATVHRIGSRAEKRVEGELIAGLKRVVGKPAILFKLARASVAQPHGAVRDVIFPAVGEQTLHDLVAEGDATGPSYRRHLQAVIHSSYRSHYRRMLPLVLDALSFRSNNQAHRPVLDALAAGHRACAALRVLDGREHGGILIADGRRCPRGQHPQTSRHPVQGRRYVRHAKASRTASPADTRRLDAHSHRR